MRINHNISALRANSQLVKTNNSLDRSLEKLTSGFKINRAADDAAGMAISQKMKTQIAALDRGSNNAADGISVIQTAEGALTEVEAMLQRMRELSVQAANETNTIDDRMAIQAEIDQLNDEIQRISDTTEFNTKTLLDGTIDRKSYSNNASLKLVSLSDAVSTGEYNINVKQDARQAVLLGTPITSTVNPIAKSAAGKININGEDVVIKEGDSIDEVFTKIRETCDKINVKVATVNAAATSPSAGGTNATADYTTSDLAVGEKLLFVSNGYGSSQSIEIHCDNLELSTALGLSTSRITAQGVDAKAELLSGFSSTATVSTKGNMIYVTDSDGFEMKFEAEKAIVGTVFTDETAAAGVEAKVTAGTDKEISITILDAGPMSLQIGANANQTMKVVIPKVNPKTLGVDNLNVCTEKGAQESIELLDDAISRVSAIRAKLGAYQNRLDHSIANLDTTSENMTEALSRIEDTDMAEEMARYTQLNVLAQAGTAMLSQANERPQTVLSLLQG